MEKVDGEVIALSPREATLKKKLRSHLRVLGFKKTENGLFQVDGGVKDIIRKLHAAQRDDRLRASQKFIEAKSDRLLKYFASGVDVDPCRIEPALERVSSGTWQGDLFRLASLTWSVPVSNGFGRRIRYLVWDRQNDKLIGLIAIGDPVFNLAVRDKLIGWDSRDRANRLVNIMDAYVLGAVPPYNALLGGKLVFRT